MLQPSDPRDRRARSSIIDKLRPPAAAAGIAAGLAGGAAPAPAPQMAAPPPAMTVAPGAAPAPPPGLAGRMAPPAAAPAQPGPPPDDSGDGVGTDPGTPSPGEEQAALQRTAPRGMRAKVQDGEHVVGRA